MHFVHWIRQDYTLMNGATLPRWGWALIVAMLATAAGLAVWALLRERRHNYEADHELTTSLLREARRNVQYEAPAAGRAADPDDYYSAAPARAAAMVSRPADDAAAVGIPDRAPGWEDFHERLGRAEDALIAASDPAAFDAWLQADWAAYEADVAHLDGILAAGAWASTPWAPRRQLAGAL
jgi:hypothetical protein